MKPILIWQYNSLVKELLLLQQHSQDPSCPCESGGEMCIRKHLLTIEALAEETATMEEDEERAVLLNTLALEAKAHRAKEEQHLCGVEIDPEDLASWSRDRRKAFEEIGLACGLAPPEENALVEEIAQMFKKKAEPRWCHPVKETAKELSTLSRTLGTARKRIAEIQQQLDIPLNICRGQAEMFESSTGVLDPYGSRCRDEKTGQWVYSEDCGYEPAGITTTALGMDGITHYEFEFKLVSLDKLIISHDPFTFTPNPEYPKELQPRLRGRAATKLQVEKIAANLEPDAVITDFHVIDRGTPIVGPDLVVEAGNGRVMGIIRAAADYPDKYSDYKQSLSDRARDYGLSAKDVDSMENPVLVRLRITDVDRTTFAQEANQAATIAPSAIENARTDAAKITMGMLQELVVGENESLEDALRAPKNQSFAKRFLGTLPENVQAALIDAHGYLNRDGVHRMAMAVFVSAFQGGPGLRLAEKAFESVDMDVRNTVNAIARSLGTMAQAEALTRSGDRELTLSIGDDLAQTVNVYSAIKRNPALTVEKYLAQEQIFARELNPFQEDILRVLEEYKRSPRKLGGIFTAYAEGVIAAPPPAQTALFPGAEITKEGLWESAVKTPEAQPVLMEIARMFEEEKANLSMPAPFAWVGGKKKLSKKIVSLIPPHKTYVEPFCGAASVFWAKEQAEVEVLNDLDPDLMRFYRDLGSVEKCNIRDISKDWDKIKGGVGNLSACEFLADVLCSYGAVRHGKSKEERPTCATNAPAFHHNLSEYQARLKKTKLYNEDWKQVVFKYDAPDTFFYLDPPYHGLPDHGYYKHDNNSLASLKEVLPKLKGKWLLTFNDHPDVREAFKQFHNLPVDSGHALVAPHDAPPKSKNSGKMLLIANYPLEGKLNEQDEEVAKMFEESNFSQEMCERPSAKYQHLSRFFTESPIEAALFAAETGVPERKIDVALAQLESGIAEIQESDKFKAFIDTMAKFHNYSLGNIMLITLQKPEASRVAGYNTWLDMGRNVIRGEHGIMILAPCFPPKPKKEEDEEDEEGIEMEPTPVYFKVVHVFDIVQTEGKELPAVEVPVITGDETGPLFQDALTFIAKQSITVSSEPKPELNPDLMGYWNQAEKLIWVRPDAPQDQRTKTLLHETAHAMCAMRGARDAEVMAESVAYTVANHFGFDTGVRSFPYVAVWARDVKVLKSNLEIIRKVAKDMIVGLEQVAGLSEVAGLFEIAKLFAPMKLLTKEIRDKLPPLYSQEEVQDPMVQVKFFTPDSNWTWYGIEFDGKDLFFGWVVGFEMELGYFSLRELQSARGPMGLAIERDKWFKPMPLSEVKKLHAHERGELSDFAFPVQIFPAVLTGLGLNIGFRIVDFALKRLRKNKAKELQPYAGGNGEGVNSGAEQITGGMMSEEHIPKEVEVFETTIAKHYRSSEDFHEGSIRVVKPEEDILVYLGCLKSDVWDAEAVICSPGATVLKTIVPNNKKYLEELQHFNLVHPEVKITFQAVEAAAEPVLSKEEQEELQAVDEALEHAEEVA